MLTVMFRILPCTHIDTQMHGHMHPFFFFFTKDELLICAAYNLTFFHIICGEHLVLMFIGLPFLFYKIHTPFEKCLL